MSTETDLTTGEVDGLPAGTVIRDSQGVVWVHVHGHSWSKWHGTNGERTSSAVVTRHAPVDVLWRPDEPVEAEQPAYSDRGFKHFDRIPSDYGGGVRVYESSAASGPHIWLSATCPSDLNNPSSAQIEAVAHLSLTNAIRLYSHLEHLIGRHYQFGGPS